MIDDLLSAALSRATDALEHADAISAAAALEQAALACEAALRQGLGLDPARLGGLKEAHARCGAGVTAARRRLEDALGAAGQARRADTAYRR